MLYNQTFNLDQVGFAAEGIKDAQQTVSIISSICLSQKKNFGVSLCFFSQLIAVSSFR